MSGSLEIHIHLLQSLASRISLLMRIPVIILPAIALSNFQVFYIICEGRHHQKCLASLLYKTNRFRIAVCLFGNKSRMTSECGKNLSGFFFLPDAREHSIC